MNAVLEPWNHWLYAALNAPAGLSGAPLLAATAAAQWSILLIPIAFVAAWVRCGARWRAVLLLAACAAGAGLLVNGLIGWLAPHPHPFMLGEGITYLAHAPDASFPSDHATALLAIAGIMMFNRTTRRLGAGVAALGLAAGLARIFLGVHYPFDVLGAVAVAGASAWGVWRGRRWLLPGLFRAALPAYRRVFYFPIARGWIKS